MNELFMQIEIFEKDRNRKICFDDIVRIEKDNQHFYIEDIDGWHARYLMSEDTIITIEFSEIIRSY